MSAVVGLSAAWRRWVIENLRAGAAIEDVIDGLVAGGAPEIVARRETASIAETLVILAEEGRLERRLALTTRLGEDPPELPTFATLENDTFLREAWRPGLPALYPGLMTHLAPWTFEALEERFGDAQVTFCSGRPADPWCDRDWRQHEETATFSAFLARVRSAGETGDPYLLSRNRAVRDTPLGDALADLRPLPDVLDPTQLRAAGSLWIGPAGTHVRLHHDQNHALFFQLYGRKRFVLHSPRLPALLAGMDGTFTTWNGGQDLPGYTVELAPGDAIFLPAGWWHAVTALSPSVSVTTTGFRWSNDFRWYAPGAL